MIGNTRNHHSNYQVEFRYVSSRFVTIVVRNVFLPQQLQYLSLLCSGLDIKIAGKLMHSNQCTINIFVGNSANYDCLFRIGIKISKFSLLFPSPSVTIAVFRTFAVLVCICDKIGHFPSLALVRFNNLFYILSCTKYTLYKSMFNKRPKTENTNITKMFVSVGYQT